MADKNDSITVLGKKFTKKNFLTLSPILCLASIIIHLPFLNQALRIDDTVFLRTAQQILKNPLDPYSFVTNWMGRPEKAFDFFSNPPLISYYLALVISFFGKKESVVHFSYLIFTLISVSSMYFFARRFTKFPLSSPLLLIATPIYMIMAHTIMPDIALLAFMLLSITLFIYGSDRENRFWISYRV